MRSMTSGRRSSTCRITACVKNQLRGKKLDSVTVLEVTTAVFEHAALLDPTILWTLGAVHLGAALILGDDLKAISTYDHRLAQAASDNGIAVVSPR